MSAASATGSSRSGYAVVSSSSSGFTQSRMSGTSMTLTPRTGRSQAGAAADDVGPRQRRKAQDVAEQYAIEHRPYEYSTVMRCVNVGIGQ